jgi:hypothetical protein
VSPAKAEPLIFAGRLILGFGGNRYSGQRTEKCVSMPGKSKVILVSRLINIAGLRLRINPVSDLNPDLAGFFYIQKQGISHHRKYSL